MARRSLLPATIVLTGACAVPHSARVPDRTYATASVGGGLALADHGCHDGCLAEPAVSPAASAQVTVGYGWRDRAHPVLLYLQAPLVTPASIGRNAPDDLGEAALHGFASVVIGGATGAYVELGGDADRAHGVGVTVNLATAVNAVTDEGGHPSGQVYAMAGQRSGGAWLDAGVRAGLLDDGEVGGGAFAAARWDRGGYRVGVWFDAGATTGVDVALDEYQLDLGAAVTGGLLIESW